MNRNLDGVYFRVNRDNEWQDICFTDLTEEEVEEVSKDRSLEWWKSMSMILRDVIRDIGDQLDLEMRYD